jgi:heme/copper-type cytochrome/quinol oxidase subunit 2
MRWISPANAAWAACLAFATSVQAQVAPDATVEKAANDELLWLAVVTMVFAVAVALWQVFKVRKAKRRNEHSALRDAATHQPNERR